MRNELLGLSQCLSSHPVLTMNKEYRVKYLNALEYFVRRFSGDEMFAQEMLNLYIETFVGKENYFYELADTKGFMYGKGSDVWNNSIFGKVKSKWTNMSKLKEYKLFRHRFALLFDCCFINAFDSPRKAGEIKWEIKNLFHERYHPKMEQLYRLLYEGEGTENFENIKVQLECWQKNKDFFSKPLRKILITANMSAGKSTLINALVGKTIARTSQEACTGNVCFLYNKAFEDSNIHLLTKNINLRATDDELHNYDWNEQISIAAFFKLVTSHTPRLCVIDTPGVDAALHKEHRQRTHFALLNESYDTIIYVVSPTHLGTDAEKRHLQWVYQNLVRKKIIFVLNKLDEYHDFSDSIEESIQNFRKDLLELGFENPIICPISAYFSYLLKLKINGQALSEDEFDEYELYAKKFKKASYDLSKYYENIQCLPTDNEEIMLSKRVGLYGFEQIIFGGQK